MIGAWLPCRLVPMQGVSIGRPVGPPSSRCTFAAWSPDGKWMYFTSSTNDAFHVWRQRHPDGQPEQLTSGPTEEEGIALAPDGRIVRDLGGAQAKRRDAARWTRRAPDLAGGLQLRSQVQPRWRLPGVSRPQGGPAHVGSERPAPGGTGDRQTKRRSPGWSTRDLPGWPTSFRRTGVACWQPDGMARVARASGLRRSIGSRPTPRSPMLEGDDAFFGKGAEVFFRRSEGAVRYAYRVLEDGTGIAKAERTADCPPHRCLDGRPVGDSESPIRHRRAACRRWPGYDRRQELVEHSSDVVEATARCST